MTKTELETMLQKQMEQNAAMQAVRAEHPRITQADLESALLLLQEHTAPKEARRAVGFCA